MLPENRYSAALVLAPPNMTAPLGGANGQLGDRIHQLPAVRAVTEMARTTLVWPADILAREVFRSLPVTFVQEQDPQQVIAAAKRHGVEMVACLYTPPKATPPGRERDCLPVCQCDEIALRLEPTRVFAPAVVDPAGRVPLWRVLLLAVRPDLEQSLAWPQLPFLLPEPADVAWAEEFLVRHAAGRPVLLLAPLAGSPEGSAPDDWWRELAALFYRRRIIVPVHDTEEESARRMLGGAANVQVVVAGVSRTAALAAGPGVHVIGIDGGRMNLMAVARTAGALAIFRCWPASAWGLPNVVARDIGLTPLEALRSVP